MKKYIKPNMEVNTIEMEEMIAASITGTSGLSDLGIEIGKDDFGGGDVDTKGRGMGDLDGNLW